MPRGAHLYIPSTAYPHWMIGTPEARTQEAEPTSANSYVVWTLFCFRLYHGSIYHFEPSCTASASISNNVNTRRLPSIFPIPFMFVASVLSRRFKIKTSHCNGKKQGQAYKKSCRPQRRLADQQLWAWNHR